MRHDFRLERRCFLFHTDCMITAMPDIDFDQLYTVQEAAKELQLAASTVASMVSRGTLETVETRFGKLITLASVEAYAAERRGKPGRKSAS